MFHSARTEAEEHILENLRQTELGRRRLLAMIRAFASESHRP